MFNVQRSTFNVFLLLSFFPLAAAAQAQMELTATEVAARMMPGWNLGNTMEAINWKTSSAPIDENYGVATETDWQDTKTTQAVIDYVSGLGFRSVRIPCNWRCGHISDATTYTIDPAWMQRVREVVDYCLDAGLYVLLNDHYDGGWLENNITATGAAKTKNKEVLKAIWTQIATEFRDYDERLLFAGLNEPNAETQAATNSLVEYEQVFIDAVRATGGNNLRRVLVVQGPNTDVEKTTSYYKTLPADDTAERLMVEVHDYTPWTFCGLESDASWGKMMYYWGADNQVSGSSRNYSGGEAEMLNQLRKMKTQFVDRGVPVIIGEYGANWRSVSGTGEDQAKHNASIKLFHYLMNKNCFEMGLVPMAWDTNYRGRPSMTIINRKNLAIYNSYAMDGIHEAMEAVGIPITAGIRTVDADATGAASGPVYNLQGHRMAGDTRQLPKGIYIRGGRKFVVR